MNKLKIITDACCHIPNAHIRGRVGRGFSACGVLILDVQGQTVAELGKYLGEMTVPEAEFNALIFALDNAVNYTRNELEIWMDSELVVRWMNGDYRMHKVHIKPLFDEAKKLEGRYDKVTYFHHPNTTPLAKQADGLANKEYEKFRGK